VQEVVIGDRDDRGDVCAITSRPGVVRPCERVGWIDIDEQSSYQSRCRRNLKNCKRYVENSDFASKSEQSIKQDLRVKSLVHFVAM
jgi:hypothetical protein